MTKSTNQQPRAQAAGDERSTAITFARPDVYYEIPPELLDTWGDDPFLAIKNIGFFLRVVLQVRLDDGSRVDFGTWLEIHSEDFRTAWQTWNFPEYKDLVVEGYVGNEIAPWGKFPHVLVRAIVRDLDEVPILESCPDLNVMRIVDGIWPRDEVLTPYASLLGDAPESPKEAGRRTAGGRSKRKANTGPGPEEI